MPPPQEVPNFEASFSKSGALNVVLTVEETLAIVSDGELPKRDHSEKLRQNVAEHSLTAITFVPEDVAPGKPGGTG